MPAVNLGRVTEFLSRFSFGTASLVLMAMSLALVGFSVAELYGAATHSWAEFGDMVYPTLLLLTAILIVVGLGLYQRLSAAIEQKDEKR